MSTSDGIRADWATKDFYQVLGVEEGRRRPTRSRRPTASWRAPTTPTPTPATPPSTTSSRRSPRPTTSSATPRSARSTTRCASSTPPAAASAAASAAAAAAASTSTTCCATAPAAGGGGFGDMFGDLFGGPARPRPSQPRRPQKGADVETTATIGFTDALDGVTISLRLTSDAPCPDCSGTGGKPGTTPAHLPRVRGRRLRGRLGRRRVLDERDLPGLRRPPARLRRAVPDLPRQRARACRRARSRPGSRPGSRTASGSGCAGKGAAGENGGPAGDLFVTVKVSPHRLFGRKGDNLTLDVPVSFDEAALGAEIKIPTLGGAPVTLKVPRRHAQRPDLPGPRQGARRKADGTNGDLLATVEVQVPGACSTTAAREAVEAYRAATGSSRCAPTCSRTPRPMAMRAAASSRPVPTPRSS